MIRVADIYAGFHVIDESGAEFDSIIRNIRGLGRGLGLGGILSTVGIGITVGKALRSVYESLMIVDPAARRAADALKNTVTNAFDNIAVNIGPAVTDALEGLATTIQALVPAANTAATALKDVWFAAKGWSNLGASYAGMGLEALGTVSGWGQLSDTGRYMREGGIADFKETWKKLNAPGKTISPEESQRLREAKQPSGKIGITTAEKLQAEIITRSWEAQQKVLLERIAKGVEKTAEYTRDSTPVGK